MNDCEELCNHTYLIAIVGLMDNAHKSNNFNDMGEGINVPPLAKCQTPGVSCPVPHFVMECGIFIEPLRSTTQLNYFSNNNMLHGI